MGDKIKIMEKYKVFYSNLVVDKDQTITSMPELNTKTGDLNHAIEMAKKVFNKCETTGDTVMIHVLKNGEWDITGHKWQVNMEVSDIDEY